MAQDFTTEELVHLARQAGLNLPGDELLRILAGVNRAKKQAAELRDIVAAVDEPATTFSAPHRHAR